jgi:hypothetical protein
MRLRIAIWLASLPLLAQERPIDAQRSSITIHVGKAGLLSAAAHEHWVNAPIASGAIDEGLVGDASGLRRAPARSAYRQSPSSRFRSAGLCRTYQSCGPIHGGPVDYE